MLSWLKKIYKKLIPDNTFAKKNEDWIPGISRGGLPHGAGPSKERDRKAAVDSPSHPIYALKKALDDLVEQSESINPGPEHARQVPSQWIDQYDKAESACKKAELWIRGGDDGGRSNAGLEKHYKDSLWKAIEQLRTAKRCKEAVTLWRLARLSSDTFTEGTVRLAESVAGHMKTDKDFFRTPGMARYTALLGIEASVLIGSETDKRKEIKCLFDGLRIDWAAPKTHSQVLENTRTIEGLIDFGGLLSNPVIIDLGFWYAMGCWRAGLTSLPEQSALFEELIKLKPNDEVFRWCKLRTDFESDPDNGVRRLEDELQYWPVAVHDDPQKLAAYFESLLAAECISELRKEKGQIIGSRRFTRKTLQDVPQMVRNGNGLGDHVSPVLNAFGIRIEEEAAI